MKFEIPYYQDYISEKMRSHLLKQAKPVAGVNGLVEVGPSGGLENTESFKFLAELYSELKEDLGKVLKQRQLDRKFIDERTKALYQYNQENKNEFLSAEYETVIGLEDANSRIVIGPKDEFYAKSGKGDPIAKIPDYLKGNHVTLFGPPDSAKMSINAMNTYHRQLPNEPEIVRELLSTNTNDPKWGADDEDSKTPLRVDLISAGENLTACFDKSLYVKDEKRNKEYKLAEDHLSQPIKRFPGLALPSLFLFLDEQPIPLHLYDFALHLFHNWHRPESLVFYVPKLENEEEAAYIRKMMFTAETMIKKIHPDYQMESIRLMIVLENPRAILRANEIMDELYPYFVGASLGWHDYLGSTARLFKEDGNYRIPVKADPDIVIKYIKASHLLLADVVGSRGGIKVGGMYGVLPVTPEIETPSFQITMKGYFKDVVTQMKRNLTGFWVAHPDFVRLGLAIVEAWKFYEKGDKSKLHELVKAILQEKYHEEVIRFIEGEDIESLDVNDPMYVRKLIVADIKESDYISNNDPQEIRYNVFQSLQYITDWLSGNGCVALPAQIEGEPVRVMDDMATAERSRWEVWHELYHGRFSEKEFLKIAHEEFNFIRKDLSDKKKIVQVKWDERTAKWYPVALNLMIRLMTDRDPVEFASELLLIFTMDDVRAAENPWEKALEIDPLKYSIAPHIQRFNYYFEMCGCFEFATTLSENIALDVEQARELVYSFGKSQIVEAASFHGNIGEAKKSLDSKAASEQAKVIQAGEETQQVLRDLGQKYLDKFGIKFLISAKGKSPEFLKEALLKRMNNTLEEELQNAREALWEITEKRFNSEPLDNLVDTIQVEMNKAGVKGCQISASTGIGYIQNLSFGSLDGNKKVNNDSWFEFASLSKPIGTLISLEYLKTKSYSQESYVNQILEKTKSSFRLKGDFADQVQVKHLMSHSALNMHYVNGIPATEKMPVIEDFLNGNESYSYPPIEVINKPGEKFSYSGAGFILLEHLIESISEKKFSGLAKEYTDKLEMREFTFHQENLVYKDYACGFKSGEMVEGGRLMFPAIAAGSMGNSASMHKFLEELTKSFHSVESDSVISHSSAVEMLHGTDKGCRDFMACLMGLGIFTIEAGDNVFALHQGANDGFRALFLYCYKGPDLGKGISIFANGDVEAVSFISKVTQKFLMQLNVSGIDYSKFQAEFSTDNLKQEEVVNTGYKELIFNAFMPMLPEEILEKGPLSPLADFNHVHKAKIIKVSNQKFARGENLLSPYEPVFDPELFGAQGKIMDSWETARHNPYEYDEMIFSLEKAKEIKEISISTKYHLGNQVESAQLFGKEDNSWIPLTEKVSLEGHAMHWFTSKKIAEFKDFKLHIYPDGGITRLGLFTNLPEAYKKTSGVFDEEIPKVNKPLTLKFDNARYGASIKSVGNEHYSPAIQVLSPYPAINMFDGLESARSRENGHKEVVVIELEKEIEIQSLQFDFQFFVNNNPKDLIVEAKLGGEWREIISKTNVKAYAGNTVLFSNLNLKTKELKLVILPDGGVNRIYINEIKNHLAPSNCC